MSDATKIKRKMQQIFESDEIRFRSHADTHVKNAMEAVFDKTIAPLVKALERIRDDVACTPIEGSCDYCKGSQRICVDALAESASGEKEQE